MITHFLKRVSYTKASAHSLLTYVCLRKKALVRTLKFSCVPVLWQHRNFIVTMTGLSFLARSLIIT